MKIEHCNDLNEENIVLLAKNIVQASTKIVPNYSKHKFHALIFATPSLPTKDENRYLTSLLMSQDDNHEMDVSDASKTISINPYQRSHFFSNIAFLGAEYFEDSPVHRRAHVAELLELNVSNVMHVYDHSFWVRSNHFVPVANDTMRYNSTISHAAFTAAEITLITERILLRYFERLLLIQKEYDEKVILYSKSENSNLQYVSVNGCLDKLLKLSEDINPSTSAPFCILDEPYYEKDDLSDLLERDFPDKYLVPKPHLPIRLPQSPHGPFIVTIYVPNLMTAVDKTLHTDSRAERLSMEHLNNQWTIDPAIYNSQDKIDRDSVEFVGLINVLGIFDDLHEASTFAKEMRDNYSNLFDVQVAQFSGKTFRYPRLSALLSSIDQSSIEKAVTVPHSANYND